MPHTPSTTRWSRWGLLSFQATKKTAKALRKPSQVLATLHTLHSLNSSEIQQLQAKPFPRERLKISKGEPRVAIPQIIQVVCENEILTSNEHRMVFEFIGDTGGFIKARRSAFL
jgi:hypothetical protein